MPWLQRNPFSPASRAGLLARMDHDGCRTFSDKVRWVEEHMPNIDDAAAFVGALVRGEQVQNPVRVKGGVESWRYAKAVADAYAAAPPFSSKNPPDAGYDNLLGEGAFSKAYAKPDMHASFYEFDGDAGTVQVDRGPRAIETITAKQVDAGEEEWGDPEGVDASKVVTLLARDRLKADKKALAYLPDLHFVRVDRRGAAPELVFAMPAYKPLEDLHVDQKSRLTRDLGRCVDVGQTGQRTLAESAQKFLDCVRRKGDPALDREAPHVAKALRTLHEVATSLPLTKYRADMHGGNVAVDAQGHLILLDPMVAEMNFDAAAKLLEGRAKKNPAQPALFRDSNKVTVTKGVFATHPEYADEAISLIGTAYAPIGGHANMRTRADLMSDDADVYRFEDIDADLEPDVLQVSKTTPYGLKTVAMGHDGTKEAKRKAVEDKIEDFRTFGNYGEVSGALAKRVLTAGVPVVGDQRLVEKILNKKVNWVGIDPDFPGIYGWYERMLGGHMHRKILVGLPESGTKNPRRRK